MADVAESASFTEPATAISQGRRHLLVRDYSSAVSALSQACDLLAQKHGDTADELGEPYLLYGRALLGLAREEAGVLGGGVPGTGEVERNDDDDDDDDEEEDDDDDDDDEDGDGDGDNDDEDVDNNERSVKHRQEKQVADPSAGDLATEKKVETVDQEKKEDGPGPLPKDRSESSVQRPEGGDSNKTDDNKIAEQKAQNSSVDSTKRPLTNGESSSSTDHNGDPRENAEDDDIEDLSNKEDEDDGANNLQVAWEVLELAKLVLLKRGPPGWKLLAESYRLLGEVAMEGGNHQGALTDLQGCLNLLEKMEPREPRALAEIHYQLGLAHSLGNDFDASIEQFKKATDLLEARIKELEETADPPKSDDPFYTIEGEIQELKDLLPEIQEKITDMRDFKQEACKLVIEGIKNKVASSCSNGAGPSNISNGGGGSSSGGSSTNNGNTGTAGTSSTSSNSCPPKQQKPATDISHLVRKKRKADEPESDVLSPLKKPTPEKAA